MNSSRKEKLKEQLLKVMDRKTHWAWSHFSGDKVTRDQLKIHFQQEYAVYIRDFPVFLSRIHGKNPPIEIRRDLAANLYEEETGGLTVGRSHPELFLYLMEGLGFKQREFEKVPLLPASRHYRRWLDQVTLNGSWFEGAAVTTIFVEGSINDREEMDPSSNPEHSNVHQIILDHPLVKFQGLDPRYMELIRAHHAIEGSHRIAAWKMVLDHAVTPSQRQRILKALERSLSLWMSYRDGIARACQLKP